MIEWIIAPPPYPTFHTHHRLRRDTSPSTISSFLPPPTIVDKIQEQEPRNKIQEQETRNKKQETRIKNKKAITEALCHGVFVDAAAVTRPPPREEAPRPQIHDANPLLRVRRGPDAVAETEAVRSEDVLGDPDRGDQPEAGRGDPGPVPGADLRGHEVLRPGRGRQARAARDVRDGLRALRRRPPRRVPHRLCS